MEKLDKVIAGLTGCIVCNCSNCEYGGDGCHRDELMRDALRILKMWDVIHKDIWDRTWEIARLKKELKAVRAELDAARNHSEDLMRKLCGSCGNGDYVHEYEMYVCRCGDDCNWIPKGEA